MIRIHGGEIDGSIYRPRDQKCHSRIDSGKTNLCIVIATVVRSSQRTVYALYDYGPRTFEKLLDMRVHTGYLKGEGFQLTRINHVDIETV
jgi:hypothetical protein